MKKYKKSRRYYYFRKQRIIGAILVGLAALSVVITGGDITAAFLLGPLGLYTMFTKEMLIADDYFYEVKSKEI
jgi:hypothetical protein